MIQFMLFFLLSNIVSASAIEEITVCYGQCPEHVIGFSISYNDGDDLDTALKSYLTDSSAIYFYAVGRDSNFKLNLSTFQGRKCSFTRLDGSTNIDLNINYDGPCNGQLSFNSIDVKFLSSSSSASIKIDVLEFIDTQIDFGSGVSDELIVGNLNTDESIYAFSLVTIFKPEYEHSQFTFDVTSSEDINISVGDKYVYVFYDDYHKTKFSYEYEDGMEAYFEIESDSKCFVNYVGGAQSAVPKLSFENFDNLIFSGDWQKTTIFPITDKRFNKNITITSYSSVLPISREGTVTTFIKINDSTLITGDIKTPVIFSLLRTTYLTDTYVNISGTYSGSLIDLGSSYIRLTINLLQINFAGKQYPFIFRVGTGGASTVSCLKTTETSTKMSQIAVYPDFNKLLSDFELNKLLSQEWNLLYLNMTLDVSKVDIILQSEPFIHGFIPNDSCLTVLRIGQTFVLSATSPANLPLSICYDGDETICDDGAYGAEIHNIDQLTTYFTPGLKVLKLTLKVSINELDFSGFDKGSYENCQVTIIGSYQITVNKVSFGSQKGIDYMEFNYINFDGTNTFYIQNVQFLHCNASSTSTINFQNNDLVTGDDNFVGTFFPCLKTKIVNFQYKMDHYDAISVDDSEYIFYDLDVNDYATPIRINYNMIGNSFIQVIYDVGMTSTSTENNLNVTINTQNPPSFNITFDVLSHDYRNEAELILYDWTKAKSNFKVNFDHGAYPVKIVLTEPYNPTQLNVIGDGKVTYVDRYSNFSELCACQGDQCKTLCPSNSSQIMYSEIDAKLKDNYNKFIVYIYLSHMAETKPQVKIESLDKKIIEFIGHGSSSEQDILIISNDNIYEVDQKLTTTHFTNLNVQPTAGTTQVVFGELRFDDCQLDQSFTKVDLRVDDFYCNFSDFELFKTVTVSDNCIVSGELAKVEKTVQFLVDQDKGDLQATLISDADVQLGENYVKIGKTRFNIRRTFVYDVILSAISGKKVTIQKVSDADEAKVPLVMINDCKGATFEFSEEWKGGTAMMGKYVFILEEIDGVTVILNGEHTPLAVSANKGDMTIISNSKSSGICGFFELTPALDTDRSTLTIKYSDSISESTITFEKVFDIGYGCTVKFSQPKVKLTVSQIIGSQIGSQLFVEHYSDLDGDSQLTVDKTFSNAMISTSYKVICTVSKPLSDTSVAAYIQTTHTLFRVNTADASSMRQTGDMTFIGAAPTTHGFTATNMIMTVNMNTGEVNLGFRTNPNELEWTICYETSTPCEVTITEDSMSKLDTLLPGGAMAIAVYMGRGNTNPINFNVASFRGSRVSITKTLEMKRNDDEIVVNALLGKDIISSLSLDNVDVKTSESDFSVGELVLYDSATINNIDNFENLTVDFKSWQNLKLSSYSKPLQIQYSGSSLTFTQNGWKLSDNVEITKANFPNLQVNFTGSVNLYADKGLATVKDIKLIIKAKTINIGPNFDSISSPTINIVSAQPPSNLVVNMNSFPFVIFPVLMEASTLKFEKSVLPFTTKNAFKLENIKPSLDFSNSDSSHPGELNGYLVDFLGSSSLSASKSDSSYPITFENVVFDNLSTVTLYKTKVTTSVRAVGSTTVNGDFDVNGAEVTFEWSLNSMPEIEFDDKIESVPKAVVIKFVGKETDETIDAASYNNFLYQKGFSLAGNVGATTCDKWLSLLSLESDVMYFNKEYCVFDVSCNNGDLMLVGRRLIPEKPPSPVNTPTATATATTTGDEGGGGKKLKPGAIAGITIAVVVVVAAACVAGFLIYKKKKGDMYKSLDSTRAELTKEQYI